MRREWWAACQCSVIGRTRSVVKLRACIDVTCDIGIPTWGRGARERARTRSVWGLRHLTANPAGLPHCWTRLSEHADLQRHSKQVHSRCRAGCIKRMPGAAHDITAQRNTLPRACDLTNLASNGANLPWTTASHCGHATLPAHPKQPARKLRADAADLTCPAA
jgi:hypothetical protein